MFNVGWVLSYVVIGVVFVFVGGLFFDVFDLVIVIGSGVCVMIGLFVGGVIIFIGVGYFVG